MNFDLENASFIGTYGYVSCINQTSGMEVWRTSLPGTGYNVVTLYYEEERLYCGSQGKFFILCAKTGKILSENGMIGQGYGIVSITTAKSEKKQRQQLPPQQVIIQQPQQLQNLQIQQQPFFVNQIPQQQTLFIQQPQQQFVQSQQPTFIQVPQTQVSNNNLHPLVLSSLDSFNPQQIIPQQIIPQQESLYPQQQFDFYSPNNSKQEQLKTDEQLARELDASLNGDNSPVVVIPRSTINRVVVPSSSTKVEDLIFTALNGVVTAFNKVSGQEIWRTSVKGMSNIWMSIIFSNGKLIVGSTGYLSCLEPLSGKEVWSNDLRGLSYAPVSVVTTSNNNSFSHSSPLYFNNNSY